MFVGLRRLVPFVALVALAGCLAATAPAARRPFRATLTADTHRPKIIVNWYYTVRVTDLRGRPLRARITVRIKDPLGGIHPVQFGRVKKDIRNYPIVGRFRDWVNWPRNSAIPGVTLVFQVVVKTAKGSVILSYAVHPHA